MRVWAFGAAAAAGGLMLRRAEGREQRRGGRMFRGSRCAACAGGVVLQVAGVIAVGAAAFGTDAPRVTVVVMEQGCECECNAVGAGCSMTPPPPGPGSACPTTGCHCFLGGGQYVCGAGNSTPGPKPDA